MIKKVLLLASIFSILFCACGKKELPPPDDFSVIKERDRIIVGVREDTAPFGYRDKEGNLAGFDIELSQLIAQHLLGDSSKVEFVIVNAGNRIGKLNSKEVDILVATMTRTEARAKVVDFSTSYFVAGTAAMVKAKSPYSSLNEFSDKPLAVVFGTTGETALRDLFPFAKITTYRTYEEAVREVKSGNVEALIADDSVLVGYAKRDNSLRLLSHRYSREPYAVAVRQGEQSTYLLQEINEIINYLQSTGKLSKLAE